MLRCGFVVVMWWFCVIPGGFMDDLMMCDGEILCFMLWWSLSVLFLLLVCDSGGFVLFSLRFDFI